MLPAAAEQELPFCFTVRMDVAEYIRDRLQFEIATGQIDPSALLDEYSMVERFASPRAAVRTALTALASAGLVHRARRSGTSPRLPSAHRDYKEDSASFRPTANGTMRTVTLSIERVPAPAEIALDLKVGTGELVTYLKRSAQVDGTPLTVLHTWTPLDVPGAFPSGLPEDKSWHELAGIMTGETEFSVQRVSMGSWATDLDSDQLGVAVGSPLTFHSRLTTTPDGKPVDRTFTRVSPLRMLTSEQFTVRVSGTPDSTM